MKLLVLLLFVTWNYFQSWIPSLLSRYPGVTLSTTPMNFGSAQSLLM